MASRSWCWAGVSPSRFASDSLQRRKRRRPSRKRSNRSKSSSVSRLWGDISCHDSLVAVPAPTPPKRLALLTALGGLLGVAGGGAAWVLLHLIGLITNLTLFHRWGWTTPSFSDLALGPGLYIAAIGAAL